MGQSLLRGCQDRDSSALGMLKRRTRRSALTADAYEEHLVLPDDRVILLTNRAMMCLQAPGFAAVHAAAKSGEEAVGALDVPACAASLGYPVEGELLLVTCSPIIPEACGRA